MTTVTNQNQGEKTIRLIDYLSQIATLRSRAIRNIQEYGKEKILWLSDIPQKKGCFTIAWGNDEEHEQDEWIEVINPREPPLPIVPAQCKDWVDESTLRDTEIQPSLLKQITCYVRNPEWEEDSDLCETIPITEYIGGHPEIQKAWDTYLEEKWQPWAKVHTTWEEIHKVYSSLFSIHQEQLRLGEEYELVLGLGLLTWKTPTSQNIRRHLIVTDVTLEFEVSIGTLKDPPIGSRWDPTIGS